MAAELIEAGVDVHEMYRRLYEGIPFGKLELLARALSNVERYDERPPDHHPPRAPRTSPRPAPTENFSEGVVDHLRSVHGTAVAALVRDLLGDGQAGRSKVSLRATNERVDVSAIARAQGGGGHRQAAGFSTSMEWPELIAFLRARDRRAVVVPRRRHPLRQARRQDLARHRGGRAPRAAGETEGRACRDPRSRSRPGCCSCWWGGRRGLSATSWRCPRPMRPRPASARCRARATRRGRSSRPGRRSPSSWCSRPARSRSARLPTRRSRWRASGRTGARGAGRRSSCPSATVTVHRFEEVRREGDRVELEIECSSGTYVRSLVADLGDAYTEALRRTAIGPFRVAGRRSGARSFR